MPTVVPTAAFLTTVFGARFLSVGTVTANSFASSTAIVKAFTALDPSWEVAVTSIPSDTPTTSRLIAPATVTTPVVALIANLPPALSLRL